jgi:hypothetical protein
VPSSKVEIKENIKKLTWWQRYVLCMNVDIDKKLHQQYVQSKHPNHNQKLIMDELDIRNKNPKLDTPLEDSGKTLSYKTWIANCLVN